MLMRKERKITKILKADSGKGYFLTEGGEYCVIDQITKEDLLRLVDYVLDEETELDDYDDKVIRNKAHQVVYKSIFDNLKSLKERRRGFIDESEKAYQDEYEKYKIDKPLHDMDDDSKE